MVTLIGEEILIHGTKKRVYEITLQNNETVFMSFTAPPYPGDTIIVIVKAQAFYKNFSPEYNGKTIKPFNIEMEQKFLEADDGFSRGITNPVPLANITYHHNKVFIEGGITRTQWLINTGANSFPVETSLENGANELYRDFGVTGTLMYFVKDN